MIDIPLPRLLNESGEVERTIRPINVSLNLSITPLSYASMQLPRGESLPARGYVELYSSMGFEGVFRVRSPQDAYGEDLTTAELEHAIVEVGDYLVLAEYDGMVAASTAMTTVFSHYRGSKWKLGDVSALGTDKIALDADHERVLEAMLAILDQKPDCMMAFDFSTSPWTVSIVKRGTTVAAEGRLARNVNSAKVIYDDTELCTRVYYEVSSKTDTAPSGVPAFDQTKNYSYGAYVSYSGKLYKLTDEHKAGVTWANTSKTKVTETPTSVWTYMDADTMSNYGLVERSISVGSDYTANEAAIVAKEYINRHKEPRVSVTITAEELSSVTGEAWDTFTVGKLCRLALVDYGVTVERVVTGLYWSDVYGSPLNIRVSLDDEEDTAITFLHDLDAKGGAGGGGASKKKEEEKWKEYFTKIEQDDYHIELMGFHVDENDRILQQAGLYIDSDGVLQYARDNENMWASHLQVQADKIDLVVEGTGENAKIRAAQIALAINEAGSSALISADQITFDGSEIVISASHLDLDGVNSKITATAEQISAEVTRATGAESSLSSRITQTATDITAEVTRATGAESSLSSRITQAADSISAEVTRATGAESSLSSRITQQADKISLVVSSSGDSNSINAASIVTAINNAGSDIALTADHISLNGFTTATTGSADLIVANNLQATSAVTTPSIKFPGESGSIILGNTGYNFLTTHYHSLNITESDGVVTVISGAVVYTEQKQNFNIADTQFYKDGVSAAQASVTLAALAVPNETSTGHPITYSTSGTTPTISFYPQYRLSSKTASSWWDKITIDDPGLYAAGQTAAKAAVTLSGTWNDYTAPMPDRRTWTVSNSANATTIEKTVRLGAGGWANNKRYVYIVDGSTNVARLEVDATSIYNSVTLSSVAKDGNATYSTNKKTVYIPVKGTLSNGNTGTDTVSCDVSDSYNAGAASVTQRTVSSVACGGDITNSSGTYTLPIKVTLSDNTTSTHNITVTTSETYVSGSTYKRTLSSNTHSNANYTWAATSAYNAGAGSVSHSPTASMSSRYNTAPSTTKGSLGSISSNGYYRITSKCGSTSNTYYIYVNVL